MKAVSPRINISKDHNHLNTVTFFVIVIIATLITVYFTLYQKPTNKSFHTLGNATIDGDLTLKGRLIYDDPTPAPPVTQPFIQYGQTSFVYGTDTEIIVTLPAPYTSSSSWHAQLQLDASATGGTYTTGSTVIRNYTTNTFTYSVIEGTTGTYNLNYLAFGT